MSVMQVKVFGTQKQLDKWCKPIEEKLGSIPLAAYGDEFLDPDLVQKTRGYIEAVVRQINSCYTQKAYDGAAVMVRRLIETLIIEMFEHKSIADQIKDGNGDFVFLTKLIEKAQQNSDDPAVAWSFSRNAKRALNILKDCGDLSAHSRTYIAKKTDLDGIRFSARIVTEELVAMADLKIGA